MAKHAVLSSGSRMWRCLPCTRSELCLDLTLACGQSFRWVRMEAAGQAPTPQPVSLSPLSTPRRWRQTAEGHWSGVMRGRVWTLTQTEDTLWYHVYPNQERQRGDGKRKPVQAGRKPQKKPKREVKEEEEEPVDDTLVREEEEGEEEREMLRDYFQLDVNLSDLYNTWGDADPHFRCIARAFTGRCVGLPSSEVGQQSRVCLIRAHCVSSGVRMLRQDPTECLFSFICTSNNHISRIQGMVERLCQALGTPLCELDQTSYHSFPSLAALSGACSRLPTPTSRDAPGSRASWAPDCIILRQKLTLILSRGCQFN